MTAPIQPNLFGEIDLKLGPRQQLVYDHIREHGSLTDDEAGALIHESRGKHHRDQRCNWCTREGRQVLASLRGKGLLTRKRGSGLWVLKDRRGPVGLEGACAESGAQATTAENGTPGQEVGLTAPDDDLSFGEWVETL